MGEPLQNLTPVMDAVRGMLDTKLFRLSHHQVTVSTVGVIQAIKKMTAEFPSINLALSLHAPNQTLRSQIVPSAKAFPLEKLLAACYDHTRGNKKSLFVEYVLLKEVNDRPEHAHELGQLLQGQAVIVNLIPYNPTDVAMDFDTPEDADVDAFYDIMVNEYKLLTTIRVHHGREIGGACGQLALSKPGDGSKGAPAVNDIEDLVGGSGKRWGKNGLARGGGAAGHKVVRATKASSGTPRKSEEEKTSMPVGTKVVGSKTREVANNQEEETGLVKTRMPEVISCSRATWLLSVAGATIALVVAMVALRIGITVWFIQER